MALLTTFWVSGLMKKFRWAATADGSYVLSSPPSHGMRQRAACCSALHRCAHTARPKRLDLSPKSFAALPCGCWHARLIRRRVLRRNSVGR